MKILELLKTSIRRLFLWIITGIKKAGCRCLFGTNISKNLILE
jgi:hypothetical protein